MFPWKLPAGTVPRLGCAARNRDNAHQAPRVYAARIKVLRRRPQLFSLFAVAIPAIGEPTERDMLRPNR